MARAGGVRRPPYGEAVVLTSLVLNGWPEFDAWCAERSIDPVNLTYQRLLNLAYAAAVSQRDAEHKETFDEMLEQAARAGEDLLTGGAARRPVDRPPSWFGDEDDVDAETAALAARLAEGRL